MSEQRRPGMPHDTAFDPTRLCANCLTRGAAPVPVGRTFGTQRDLEQVEHLLCRDCCEALLVGRFDNLGERHTDRRTVERLPEGASDGA